MTPGEKDARIVDTMARAVILAAVFYFGWLLGLALDDLLLGGVR